MQELIKQLETIITINGNEVAAIIRVSVSQDEDFSIDDIDFDNEEDKARFERKLNRGELTASVVLVEVHALGEAESVALGSVLVASQADIDTAVEDHGLIEEATEFVVKAITDKYEMLKPYFQAA